MFSCLSLFATSFLAATVLPFSSEFLLWTLLAQGGSPWLLISIASLGNTLGAALNWYLGRYLLRFQDRRWFYFRADELARMQLRFQRYGLFSLLFSWLPLIGDAIPCVAGIMRVNFWIMIALVGTGKTLRYLAVFWLANS